MTETTAPAARDQALADLFSAALEGGIGYWSTCSVYRWRKPGSDSRGSVAETQDLIGFHAVIQDTEDDEATEYRIDRDVIRRGMQRLYKHMIGLGDDANRYQLQACRDFNRGNWDDFDFDSDTGDMVVQFGLFGEIRYA